MIKLRNVGGGHINRVITRNKFLNAVDSLLDVCLKIFPNRADRRYKSFIGNYFITAEKQRKIERYTSQLAQGRTVVDVGCAEGSLLYRLRAKYKTHVFYGCDSGYKTLYEMQNRKYPNVHFHDLDIQHPHYSPSGANRPEEVSLNLPEGSDLVIMYDVLPYLNEVTQRNYLSQIGSSLKDGGELILTAMLKTDAQVLAGARGEVFQSTTSLDIFLTLAREQNLILFDCAIGGWNRERVRWDTSGADVMLFRKILQPKT